MSINHIIFECYIIQINPNTNNCMQPNNGIRQSGFPFENKQKTEWQKGFFYSNDFGIMNQKQQQESFNRNDFQVHLTHFTADTQTAASEGKYQFSEQFIPKEKNVRASAATVSVKSLNISNA